MSLKKSTILGLTGLGVVATATTSVAIPFALKEKKQINKESALDDKNKINPNAPIIRLANPSMILGATVSLSPNGRASVQIPFAANLYSITENDIKAAFEFITHTGEAPTIFIEGLNSLVNGGDVTIIVADAQGNRTKVTLTISHQIQDPVQQKIIAAQIHAASLVTDTLVQGATEPVAEKQAYERAKSAIRNANAGNVDSLISPLNVAARAYENAIKAANAAKAAQDLTTKINNGKTHAAGLITNHLVGGATEPTAEKTAYEVARRALENANAGNANNLINALNHLRW